MSNLSWRLDKWNRVYGASAPIMTDKDIATAIGYLRGSNYPPPEDCPQGICPKLRPACGLGICNIAVGMCGDF